MRRIYSPIFRRCIRAYLFQRKRIWSHLSAGLRVSSAGRAYGSHLHALVRSHMERAQSFGTFFLRNRAELQLISQLIDQKVPGSSLSIAVIACSKGCEVYSILWTIRRARPDLRITASAVDISREILGFAQKGVYSRNGDDLASTPHECACVNQDITWKDQPSSIFERMQEQELRSMFDVEGDRAEVKSWLREGILWVRGDAGDPELVSVLGLQDVVVANRFLCHMKPMAQEKCLRNVARLVKPGGYIFVSGVDLDVRTRVALELGWKPVPDLLKEIHEGDGSLRQGWPLEYWGLEPFCDDRPDWKLRYASVFQLGETL
jgi:chemotaxis methyl-accepting protein methylase